MTLPAFKILRLGFTALLTTCVSAGYIGQVSAETYTVGRLPKKPAVHRSSRANTSKLRIYVGTYTDTGSKGIYIYQMDPKTGLLTAEGTGPALVDPSFLVIRPDHRFLYADNESVNFQGTGSGAISALAIDPKTGGLTLIDQQGSHGSGPCFVGVDGPGKNILTANYGSGSVAVLPIRPDGGLDAVSSFDQHDGSSTFASRQEGPHAHTFIVSPDNKFAVSADLGNDKLLVYHLDSDTGTITPNNPPFFSVTPGSGPRHIAFDPDGHHAYLISEIACTMTALNYDPAAGVFTNNGVLSTLPTGYKGENTCAEVQVHPSGKFVYGSNRGHDSIAIFSVDPGTHKLHLVGIQSSGGKTPRSFTIDPTGHFLLAANQGSNNLAVFRIDPKTGKLKPITQNISLPKPCCVVTMPIE